MFGFYALCGKSSSILGPVVFGQVSLAFGGNQRVAVPGAGRLLSDGAYSATAGPRSRKSSAERLARKSECAGHDLVAWIGACPNWATIPTPH